MPATLDIRFECHNLPRPGIPLPDCQRLGIQEGKEVIRDFPFGDQAEIHFEFTIQAEVNPASDLVIFRGKFVQGPRTEPFIYLCWGDRSGGAWLPCGRSKIPLSAIPRQQIQRALADGNPIRARIGLTGKNGNPAFATLKADLVEWIG